MKKLAIVTALLGAGIAAQSAQAIPLMTGTSSIDYYENNPAKSSFTITLSGECSGKIELPVTQVYYSRDYDYTGGTIDRDGMSSEVYIYTNNGNMYAYGSNYGYVPGDKLSESVKNDKFSLNMLVKSGNAYPYIYGLEDGDYDSLITCKSGLTLDQTLIDWDPYFETYAASYKSQASLSHTHTVSSPGTGEYKVKFSASGEMQQQGQCTIKGDLFSADYSLVCAPPKSIKIKVAASAEGTSLQD